MAVIFIMAAGQQLTAQTILVTQEHTGTPTLVDFKVTDPSGVSLTFR